MEEYEDEFRYWRSCHFAIFCCKFQANSNASSKHHKMAAKWDGPHITQYKVQTSQAPTSTFKLECNVMNPSLQKSLIQTLRTTWRPDLSVISAIGIGGTGLLIADCGFAVDAVDGVVSNSRRLAWLGCMGELNRSAALGEAGGGTVTGTGESVVHSHTVQ